MANLTTKYTEIDNREFNRGWDSGNYASAYETEDYGKTQKDLIGTNGFYRIGHLLGFFSSYELYEISDSLEINGSSVRDEVSKYRIEFSDWI
jgi:hypothetical protein